MSGTHRLQPIGKVIILVLWGSLALFSTCANSGSASVPSSQSAVPHADNFAFIFRSRSCGLSDENVLNTAQGTLVHTPIGETVAITILLRLTEDEMDAIYRNVIDSAFFSYPADLRVPQEQVTGFVVPAATYYLRVTNGTQTNEVTWTDDVIEPKRADIERFRELINLINKTMQAHPEMQHLPAAKAGCL